MRERAGKSLTLCPTFFKRLPIVLGRRSFASQAVAHDSRRLAQPTEAEVAYYIDAGFFVRQRHKRLSGSRPCLAPAV